MTEQHDPPKDEQTAEFDKLARRYLDLWQSQLSGLAADQSLTEQIARLFAAANAQVASAMQGVSHGTSARNGTQNGPAPAAAPSGDSADDLGQLRQRVATLEARIAELEEQLRNA